MAPADGPSMALALNPNVTWSNVRLIAAASRNGARFARIYLYLHPRQSQLLYRLVARIFPRCSVTSYRHRNLDTLVTFPSSIILEFDDICTNIYMVTYLAKANSNTTFEAAATSLRSASELEKVLLC
jgi:hypothetical protein